MADEHYAAAAAAEKGQVEALLKKFDTFASAPSTGGASEGDTTQGAPLADADSIQG